MELKAAPEKIICRLDRLPDHRECPHHAPLGERE
jgi:hypothetical protein